jgi:protein-S-isoprenylcysteine O-methyltransferase Ste14
MILFCRIKLKKQLWPPPGRNSWQCHIVWWSVRVIAICIGVISFQEWATLPIPDQIRFNIALPVFLFSASLGTLGFIQLGWRNTHGGAEKFIDTGIYKYSRNPQYLFYSISFISLGLLVASPKALVLLVLMSVWYLLAPFPEETWLEKQYGQRYLKYKSRVPRYFGFKNA